MLWQHICTFIEKTQVFSENLGYLSENPGFLSENPGFLLENPGSLDILLQNVWTWSPHKKSGMHLSEMFRGTSTKLQCTVYKSSTFTFTHKSFTIQRLFSFWKCLEEVNAIRTLYSCWATLKEKLT